MTATLLVRCPDCDSDQIVKRGRQNDKQRYCCQESSCARVIFQLQYTNRAYVPGVKQQIVEMTINGSGIRDIARVLKVSPNTVITEIKKKRQASLK